MSDQENGDGVQELTLEEVNAIRLKAAKERAKGVAPKFVNGRKAALACLDYMIGKQCNVQKLAQAIQERIDVDAVGFYRDVVMPLTPKTYTEKQDVGDDEQGGTGKKVVVMLPDNGRPKAGEKADA